MCDQPKRRLNLPERSLQLWKRIFYSALTYRIHCLEKKQLKLKRIEGTNI